jgi:hypothetical protein
MKEIKREFYFEEPKKRENQKQKIKEERRKS